MALVEGRWVGMRIAVAALALGLCAATALAGVATQRTVFILAAAVVALVPLAYGLVAAIGRAPDLPRATLVVVATVTVAVVAASGWLTLSSCQNNLDPRASLAGCDLARMVLTDGDLHGADLTGADLGAADLTGADLTGADLTGADLSDADLSRALLAGSTLRNADVANADLTGADLTDADLSHADLFGATLAEADLRGADVEGITLAQATMIDARLGGLDLSEVAIPGSDLSRADLADAALADAELRGARFSEATLNRASLVRAALNGADLTSASLVSADLTRADLAGADLAGADLDGATFDGVSLIETEGLDDRSLASALDVAERDLPRVLAERNIRLEPRDDIVADLAAGCRGGARDTAAVTDRGFRPLVVLGTRGTKHGFTDQVPRVWEPMSTRFAQLVACVGEERQDLVEVCNYFNASTGAPAAPIRRFSRTLSVRLVAARTGKLVEERVFSHAPEPCAFQVFGAYDTSLVGSEITFRTIRGWLGGHVR